MKTKSGRVLSDDDIAALAAKAEAGFDLATWQPKRGRPALDRQASTHSPRMTVRVPRALQEQVERRAADEGRSVSEVARALLEEYVATRPTKEVSNRRPRWISSLDPAGAVVAQFGSSDLAPRVWTAFVVMDRWKGGDPAALPWQVTYGKSHSVVADEHGGVSLAEVELVKKLRSQGWSACWVDAFGRAPTQFQPWISKPADLPAPVREKFLLVESRAKTLSASEGRGRPDIVAWRGKELAFLEAKGPGDRVRDGQDVWARAATEEDQAYGLVQWALAA